MNEVKITGVIEIKIMTAKTAISVVITIIIIVMTVILLGISMQKSAT